MAVTLGEFDEYPSALAARIASKFRLASPIEALDFPERGNINRHTYLILSGKGKASSEFLLQEINQNVFRRPRNVMAAMLACIEAQRRNAGSLDPAVAGEWTTIELIPTRRGSPYLEFEDLRGRTYWRLMKKIADCRTYKSLSELPDRVQRLHIAEQAGRGLALFSDLTSDMDVARIENPLPGYRDTRLYYRQLHSILAGYRSAEEASDLLPEDPVLRNSTEIHFLRHLPDNEYQRRRQLPDIVEAVELALENERYSTTLLDAIESGRIRRVAVHGDTKLENFLFSLRSGQVKALIDLDTIMPQTWLSDWGDMVRSLTNIAGEKEPQPSRISVDLDVFDAIARGFLRTSRTILEEEVQLMVDAARVLALELGVRFLTDYLRGDTYFRLSRTDPPDLNRVRAVGQLTLFRRLHSETEALRRSIERWWRP